MPPALAAKLLRLACLGALGALGLMTWQLFDPTVVPVIVAMSLGQVLGTASFALYLVVVAADLRKYIGGRRALGRGPGEEKRRDPIA